MEFKQLVPEFEKGFLELAWLKCPHCDEPIIFKWDNLQWSKIPNTKIVNKVWYACPANGCVIEEHEKTRMLAEGKWIAKYPERSHLHRGYHWNALYAPLGLGFRWIELVLL